MKLSLERLKYLAAHPSEVYAKETQAMARMCINAHPDSFMEGFEPSDWPENPPANPRRGMDNKG